jgi:hypothetical protein
MARPRVFPPISFAAAAARGVAAGDDDVVAAVGELPGDHAAYAVARASDYQ